MAAKTLTAIQIILERIPDYTDDVLQ